MSRDRHAIPHYSELRRFDDILVLTRANDEDDCMFIPIQSVLNWHVDWTLGGGCISIVCTTGYGDTKIGFPDGNDGISHCCDALDDIMDARRFARGDEPIQPNMVGPSAPTVSTHTHPSNVSPIQSTKGIQS